LPAGATNYIDYRVKNDSGTANFLTVEGTLNILTNLN